MKKQVRWESAEKRDLVQSKELITQGEHGELRGSFKREEWVGPGARAEDLPVNRSVASASVPQACRFHASTCKCFRFVGSCGLCCNCTIHSL